MAVPESLVNDNNQSLDTLYAADGTPLIKKGLYPESGVGLDPDLGHQAIGTHVDGATWSAGQPVVALGGVDETGTDTVRRVVIDASGRLLVVTIPTQTTFTDGSGNTSGTPSTSTQVFNSNANRKMFLFQNISDTDMWLNFGSAATAGAGSFKVEPGSGFSLDGNMVTTQAINVLCASATKAFTAKEA